VDEIEDYIKVKQVDQIFKSLLVRCFRERPENPVAFVFDHLIDTYPEEAAERLGGSPRAVPGVPASQSASGQALTVSVKHINPDMDLYLNNSLDIGSLFSHLCQELATHHPEDPVDFLVKTMTAIQSNEEHAEAEDADYTTDGGNTTQGEDMYEDFSRRASITGRRTSVSAECNVQAGSGSSPAEPVKEIPKTEEEREEIMSAIAENILFKDLDDALKDQVVLAVYPQEFTAGSTIIKQGDEGENCFIMREGEAMVFCSDGTSDTPKHLITYGPKATFGELALMYGNKRAATVKAKLDVRVWALNRVTFRSVVYKNMTQRRATHESFLTKVPILSMLTEQQRALVADVLVTKKYSQADNIITQGELGEHFYIIEEGHAEVIYNNNGKEVTVRSYGPGDYFGELAFLTNTPRAATVVCTTGVTCVAMDKSSFKRLLGPCEEHLRNNMEGYRKAIDKYIGSAVDSQ